MLAGRFETKNHLRSTLMSKQPDYMKARQQEEFRPAQTITSANVEKATGVFPCSAKARRYHRHRIAVWGQLNRDFLRSIGAQIIRKVA
jgi:hypothetical protein